MNCNKLPTGKYIHLGKPEIEISEVLESSKYVANLQLKVMARIDDLKDKAICDAIIDYAKEQGITDLFLIDEEFVKSALINEKKGESLHIKLQMQEDHQQILTKSHHQLMLWQSLLIALIL